MLHCVTAHMPKKGATVNKCVRAQVALVATLAGVAAHMPLQGEAPRERGWTQVALERALARVRAQVFCHVRLVGSLVSTQLAQMQPATH